MCFQTPVLPSRSGALRSKQTAGKKIQDVSQRRAGLWRKGSYRGSISWLGVLECLKHSRAQAQPTGVGTEAEKPWPVVEEKSRRPEALCGLHSSGPQAWVSDRTQAGLQVGPRPPQMRFWLFCIRLQERRTREQIPSPNPFVKVLPTFLLQHRGTSGHHCSLRTSGPLPLHLPLPALSQVLFLTLSTLTRTSHPSQFRFLVSLTLVSAGRDGLGPSRFPSSTLDHLCQSGSPDPTDINIISPGSF